MGWIQIDRNSGSRKVWMLILCGVSFCCAFTTAPVTAPPPEADTIRVVRGTFVNGVEDVGVITATRSRSVVVESHGQIARIVTEGSDVKKGQPVLWLDDEDIRTQIQTERINLKRSASDLERAEESLAESRFNLEQTLKEKVATHRFDQLNVERAQREVDRILDRYERHLVTDTEVAAAQSTLEQNRLKENTSRLALERAQAEYDSKLKSLETELAIARQEYERSQFRMADLEERLAKTVLKAPADGVVVIKKNWRKEPFKVGDRVWSGISVLEIPDLTELQVWSQVPEAHLQDVSVGQDVTVRVPALENLVLEGSVASISWLAMPRVLSRGTNYTSDDTTEGGRVFEVLVNLSRPDPRLKTGMNVAVVFVEERVEDVLMVPVSAVADVYGNPFVFIEKNGTFHSRDVDVGPHNKNDIIIRKGLREGQQIALYHPG